MLNSKQILVAIDDFQRANHLVDYVAGLAAGPMPPQLLESPGAEGSAEEQHIEHRQARQQDNWIDRTREKIEPQFATEKSRLRAANVPDSEIETHLLVAEPKRRSRRRNHQGRASPRMRHSHRWTQLLSMDSRAVSYAHQRTIGVRIPGYGRLRRERMTERHRRATLCRLGSSDGRDDTEPRTGWHSHSDDSG